MPDSEFETLLQRIASGDNRAQDQLFEAVYEHLRGLARAHMSREQPGRTLQPTALVNEAYLKLSGGHSTGRAWENVGHFIGAASRAMRQVLIDRARRYQASKHGGDRSRVPLDSCEQAQERGDWHELLWLDTALDALSTEDAELARLVELKYFLDLSIPTIAQALGVSERTVGNRWRFARVWLRNRIRQVSEFDED